MSSKLKTQMSKLQLKTQKLNILSVLMLLVSGVLLAGVSLAGASTGDDFCDLYQFNRDTMTQEIFANATGLDPDFNFATMFTGTPENVQVKDLYLNVYKALKQNPASSAMKEASEKYSYTETEFCSILGGNLQLLSTTQDENEVSNLIDLHGDMKADYEAELESAELAVEMMMDIYPKEIFANGDTSDSGFDLMYDLELIEYILFGEDSYSVGDAGDFQGPDDDGVDGDAGGDGDEGGEEDEDEGDGDGDGGAGGGAGSGPGEETETESGAMQASEDDEVNPARCVADGDVQAAFAAALGEDYGADDEEEETGGGGSGSGDGGGAGGGSGDGSGEGESGDATGDGEGESESRANDWTFFWPCNEFFCIFIDFTNTKDPEYRQTDNCVKCHADYISDALDETLSVPLIPGKMSGNLLEPAMCKRSAVNGGVSLNLIPVAVPIPTPSPDYIVGGLNFWEAFTDFAEDTWGVESAETFPTEEGEERDNNLFLVHYEQQLSEALKNAQKTIDNPSTEEILTTAFAQYENQMASIATKFAHSSAAAEMEATATFYQSLQYEMNQMVFYFSSYQMLIGLTQEVAEELATNLKKA